MAENRLEEVLARRLDQALPPDRTSLPPVTPDPLVNIAARIASMSVAEPSDIALARMEAKMLAAFDRQHVPQKQQRRQPRRWTEYAARWAVAASLILVFLIIGALPASAGSLPGEPLYPVKRLVERVELALASSPDAAALLRLQHAERRALETLTLLERGQLDESLLAEAVSGLDDARQAASAEFSQSLAFQWQQQQVSSLIEFASDRAEAHQPETAPPSDSVAASETPTPTATQTATLTSTATASQTLTDDATVSPTRTPRRTPTGEPSPESTSTARPTRTPRRTPTTTPPEIVPPTRAPLQPTDCPGNSCNSAGVPGGQIDPNAPPGQSGGRSENPPDPPGQGEPGGGQNNNPGQGNSGNQGNIGNGQNNNPGNGNSNNSGGSAPTAPPPPPDSSSNSGNQGNIGNGQETNPVQGNTGNGQNDNPGQGNTGNGQENNPGQGNTGNGQENAGNGGNNPNGNGGDCPGNSCN